MFRKLLNSIVSSVAIVLSTVIALPSFATIVEFETSLGNFKVNLHDETTPKTVANFLEYVNDGTYNNTIVHRSVDNFVIQGGGFSNDGTLSPKSIEVKPTIINEPIYSNVIATIAMAKTQGNINSATSQWFINLRDNANSLDPIDIYGGGAYAVFGEVVSGDMTTIAAIAATPKCNLGGAFTDIPMPNYICTNGGAGAENFVTIISVTISDSTVTSASSLNPVMNTLFEEPKPATPTDNKTSSGGGGSTSWFMLALLGVLSVYRKRFYS
jgi:cyclophilin family peptidyl-prolyl cis-trans isomerase